MKECSHKKIIDVVEDYEKASKKDIVKRCFECKKFWVKKDWEKYLKENRYRITE